MVWCPEGILQITWTLVDTGEYLFLICLSNALTPMHDFDVKGIIPYLLLNCIPDFVFCSSHIVIIITQLHPSQALVTWCLSISDLLEEEVLLAQSPPFSCREPCRQQVLSDPFVGVLRV